MTLIELSEYDKSHKIIFNNKHCRNNLAIILIKHNGSHFSDLI